MTVEPGRQLAGRYRVEDLLAERAGARLWRAVDEVLRRSVAVDVLPAESSRASAVVQAARRAAVVTDGRFLRVLDAAEENGDVYVVREWAPGESLDLVLADGPLTHRRAAWVVHEVAEAVSVAHGAGIYHLRLTPQNILVTDTGGVKIIGLATDAALHGVRHADAEAEDVRALGRLLYASLVARWPGGPDCPLPSAPMENGRVMRPSQVRAGVPRQVDEVCDRILGEPPQHKAEPLRHASDVAAELDASARLASDSPAQHDPEATQAGGFGAVANGHAPPGPPTGTESLVPPPRSLRPAAPAPGAGHGQTHAGGAESTRQIPAATSTQVADGTRTFEAPPPPPPPADLPPPRGGGRRREGRGRGLVWVGVVAVVAVLAAAAFFLGLNSTGDPGADQATGGGDRPAADPMRPVSVSTAQAFDPFGEDGENDEEAPLVVDGDPATQWHTLSYQGSPEFGGLKPGLGLILDLGRTKDVRQVTLDLDGSGTDLQVRAAPARASSAPGSPDEFTTVGSAGNTSGKTRVRLDRPVSTRFLLVWFTRLAPEPGGTYSASVNEIRVAG